MDKFSAIAVASQLRILRAILASTEPGLVIPPALRAQALHEVNEMIAALHIARSETLAKFSSTLLAQERSLKNVTGLLLGPLIERESDKPIPHDEWAKCEAVVQLMQDVQKLDESQRHLSRYIELYFDVQIRKFQELSGVIAPSPGV